MRERFVPPAYHFDLRKKIATLRPSGYVYLGIRVGVHEEAEDKICRFYSGMRTEIQDIVDSKEYSTINLLF
jgi:hypothetical protein